MVPVPETKVKFQIVPSFLRASLVAQMVKNLPAVQETQFSSLGWEDFMEKKMQPSPIFLPGEFHGQRSLVDCNPWSCRESDTTGRHIHTQALESCSTVYL